MVPSLRYISLAFLLGLLAMSLAWVPHAWCLSGQLSGVAEWEYADYTAQGGLADINASHFTQKYTLLYKASDLLYGGRLGHYSFSLGTEWAALDNDYNGDSNTIDRLKFLYSGNLTIAPGALPFRLDLYSGDTRPVNFVENLNLERYRPMIRPGIATDVHNGQSFTNRATLIVGIRNGSYLGNYRELLSKFPRLLFDYKDNYTRDLKRDSPVDYRLRDLAFISLNKKDNWFHYRVKDFSDNIDPGNNWNWNQLMLGTVDHVYRRQWVNLTNWIKISADGSITETSGSGVADEEQIRLNLFSMMRRNELSVNNFSNYSRSLKANGSIQKRLNIPTYMNFKINRLRTLRAAVLIDRDETTRDLDVSSESDSYYAQARLNQTQTSRRTLTPYLELQVYDTQNDESSGEESGEGARVGLELSLIDWDRSQDPLKIDYSLAVVRKDNTDFKNGEYLENRLKILLPVDFTRNFRARFEQDLIFGYGNVRNGSVGQLSTYGDDDLPVSSVAATDDVDYAFISNSYAGLFYNTKRFRNTLALRIKYSIYGLSEQYADNDSLQFRLEHRTSYANNAITATVTNRFYFNKGLELATEDYAGSSAVSDDTLNSRSKSLFVHNSKAAYAPNRSWYHKAEFNFVLDESQSSEYSLSQNSRYTIFTRSGFVRKLATLQQNAAYEHYSLAGNSYTESTIGFSASYLPYRNLELNADFAYILYEDGNKVEGGFGASLDFKKLQTYIRYRQAQLDYDDGLSRTDRRWEAGLRKLL